MPKPRLYARRLTATVLLVLVAAGAARAAEPPCAACVLPVITPGASLLLPDRLGELEILIRTGGERPGGLGHLRAAMEAVRAAGGRPGLVLEWPAASPPERASLQAASRILLDLTGLRAVDDETAFALRSRLAELRGLGGGALLGVLAGAAVLDELIGRDFGAYVDFVVRPGGSAAWPPGSPGFDTLGVVEHADGARAGPAGAASWIVGLPADALTARDALADLAMAAPLLGPGLIPGGTADVRCGAERLDTYLDPATLDTIAVAAACDAAAVVPAGPRTEQVRLSGGGLIVRVPAAEGVFSDDVRVVGARTLTVREIVARHQAAAARQRREITQLISTGSMTLTFEAPGFPAPMAITSETVVYAGPDRTEMEQRDIRINGVAFRTDGIPRLPLLEPERVATPPLAITLTELYAYELAGRDTVNGVPCYVVAFTPTERNRPLFSGRAWIAADSFAMVRVSAVQTALRGPIVSSEQTDEFRQVGTAWLLSRSDVRQIYEGAGHRTPIHRVLAIVRHEVNPPDFTARRQAAYRSPSVMLRDTPEGFRYLRRERSETSAERNLVPAVTGPATRVRTFAAGVLIDPNITRPLPFAGLSYVDFDLFGTGSQVNAFFGGTYGQVAVSVPSLGGSRWQLAGRAFGIASSYHDRAFVNGREVYEQNILQRPAHASAWLLRPLTPRLSTRIGYELDYIRFRRAETTAPAFVVPAAQAAHALRAGAEAQWGGWTVSGWWAGVHRAGWRAWGDPGAPSAGAEGAEPSRHRDYQRFGGGIGRSWVASPRLVGRIDASWMGGRDQDRFSRYTFGSFDNRLRGYPAALIRYDRGGVLRASAAWAAGRLLRIDGFTDSALVRDAGSGGRLRSFTGVGAAAEVPIPFGTLLTVEWGYGFQGVNTDGSRGTHVVRISGYKMF